jgi:hypothetical protein
METRELTRRGFLKQAAGLLGGSILLSARGLRSALSARQASPEGSLRKKVAILATEVRKYCHAQHFVDRFLEGYGWHGSHHRPPMDLVSLYVDQFPEGDLSRDRERRHGVKIHPTIAEALTLGASRLSVDGVLIIGEHGSYPTNSKGQRLYPRYKFFKEAVKVFEESGRAVPVFNDKHLSTDWAQCEEMVKDSQRLGFPFLAGSSLPVTWRIPSLDMPLGAPLEESVCVGYGGVDSYDFHGLETAQCMSERRDGGERGVRSVHAVRGEKVWELLKERQATLQLALEALTRSHSLKPPPGYSFPVPDADFLRLASSQGIGYFIEHADGFKTTLLLLNGFVEDFNYAGRIRGSDKSLSCQMYLPMPPRQTTLADFFNPLVNNIEEMILTGKAPYPIERALLTSGVTLFAVESLYRGEVPLRTPEMEAVSYRASERSTFWRA